MLQILRDKMSTAKLKARQERLIHERMLELTEASSPQPVSGEPGQWTMLGSSKNSEAPQVRSSTRDEARRLIRENPHACHVLRILDAYITGPGLQLTHQFKPSQRPSCDVEPAEQFTLLADQLWNEFLTANSGHYSFREHARRTWRDGECFVRKFSSSEWPPAVRYLDPETIAETPETLGSQGILNDRDDVETPLAYLWHRRKLNPKSQAAHVEEIPADEILHTRISVDSNEKRGVSLFAPIVDQLNCYTKWLQTELLARKLQSSIVLWRKVQGSPQGVESFADQTGSYGPGSTGTRREKFAPGTVITTNHGTDIQFLQPNTNFGDAVSLGRMILLSIAAGAGLPEFMLTADASNSNFASTMIAEGPAVKYFQSQQELFASEFQRLWRWIMQDAISTGLLPAEFFDLVTPKWSFPPLVNRDRPKERLADVRLVESGILSRAEVARRDGVDPRQMQTERMGEWPLNPPSEPLSSST